MKQLLNSLKLLKSSPVGEVIRTRIAEFIEKGNQPDEEIFKELCFCILTANYTAEGGMRIQKEVGSGFLTLSQIELSEKLKYLGHRFPNARSRYIVLARRHKDKFMKMFRSTSDQTTMRDRIVESILGLGYKEASHFLRNIGYDRLAIIDFHIIDLLERHHLIKRPKSKALTKKKYLEIEALLGKIARKSGLTQGELDLYLWYIETGKVLK